MLTTRHYLYFLIIFALFLPLGLCPLFDLDEGAFTEATREMLLSGNYLTTYLEGKLRFDKPILTYWLQAISTVLFGTNEVAFRLPSSLATAAWANSLYQFCKKHLSQKQALTCVILFISCILINIIGKAAISDAILNLCITSSMLNLYNFLTFNEKKHLRMLYIASAFGFLTKGPIALLIPGVTIAIYSMLSRDLESIKALYDPLGFVCFLAIGTPWYICEYMEQGQRFIEGFFFKHNLNRFANPMEKHSGNIFYYIPILLIGLMPFTGYYLHAMQYIDEMKKDPLQRFMLVWFGFVLIFFSLAATKLPHYIVYGIPPLLIIASQHSEKTEDQRWISYPLVIIFIIFTVTPELLHANIKWIQDPNTRFVANTIQKVFSSPYPEIMTLCAFGGLIPWIKTNGLSQHTKMLITTLCFSVSINYVITPRIASIEQVPIKHAAQHMQQIPQSVVPYRINTPSFSVYSKKLFNDKDPSLGDIILLRNKDLGDFNNYTTLFNENGIYLIKLEKSEVNS